MKKYVFGADIGGTTVKLGFFTVEGELLDKWEIPTRKDEGGRFILPDVAASLEAKLVERSVDKEEIIGVGIGVPGPVKDDGTVLRCVNLGWGVFNVEEEFEKIFGLPVKVGNDANMASLGEMWQGGGKGYQSIVMVTLGTGVGGGIIINGKMLSGTNGAGGEIGHICVNDNETEVCGCGKKGCLEQYTSATGITRMAERTLTNTDRASKLRIVQYISAKEIFDAAKEGDDLAMELVENHGKTLGKALASVSCVCDPEAFVIGGGVSKAGDILLETTAKYYQQYAFHASKGTKFVLATLGNDAGIYGCAEAILTKE
ncbi:MAG: ROK family glucokinase [Clostridiales bacterium]|nr:ROK family glucokinase [Clostridiales bacterium]